MLTHDGARLQVFLELRRRHGLLSGPHELIILDAQTIERPWGWVFFYTTKGAGYPPIIINRFDGTIRDTGTANSVTHYIAEYETHLERKHGAWELFIQETEEISTLLLSTVRGILGLSVSEAVAMKKELPCVWRKGAKVDLEPFLFRLVAAGVAAEIRARQDESIRG